MVSIISDSSTMYSTKEASEAGFSVSPLTVAIAGKSYREIDEISSSEFLDLINQGNMPVSSQPAIGTVIDLYDDNTCNEVINLCMADGLSGTYKSAVAAVNYGEYKNVKVVNTKTLCGPHRYMVENAVKMAREGCTIEEIITKTEKLIDSAKSFLLPEDFDYLRRGGRLSPVVAKIGKISKFVPVMTQTSDGKRIEALGVKRNFKCAVEFIGNRLKNLGVGSGWNVYVSHAGVPEYAEKAKEILQTILGEPEYRVFELTPAFITQGGPGCVAIQIVNTNA